MRAFRYKRLLQWSECDPAGIVFFPHYARWMVEGVNLMFLALNLDPNSITDSGARRGLPSTGLNLAFQAPLTLHDQFVHEILVKRLGNKSLDFTHRFLRGTQCVTQAEETRVWSESDASGMRAVAIPEQVRELLISDEPLTHPLVNSPAPTPTTRKQK